MTRLDFLNNLNDMPDGFLESAGKLLRRKPEAVRHFRRKRILGSVLAAALILALGATAYAIGVSVHRQRQEQIREKLQIDENEVGDYVEFSVPEDAENMPDSGVTLLSTMNDGTFQQVWVIINGVTPEMAESMFAPILTDRDGTPLSENDHRYRWIFCSWDGEHWSDTQAGGGHSAQHLREAYDADSQTLMLNTALTLWDLPEHFTLRFVLVDCIDYGNGRSDAEMVCDLGSVAFSRTDQSVQVYWFPEPVLFENGDYGKGEFLGMEISASGVKWVLRHDGGSQMYHPREFASEEERQAYMEMERSWLAAIEKLERDAVLHFADGSTRAIGLPLNSETEGDIVKDVCLFGDRTIDVNQVIGVTIGGKTFSFGT